MNQFSEDEEKGSLGEGIAEYFRTRLQLLAIECQEAGGLLRERMVPLAVILLSGLTAYLLFTCALIGLLGRLLQKATGVSWIGWEAAALLVAGPHLIALFRMKKKLASPLRQPLFEYSRAELERDRTWIQENNPTKKN